MLFRFRVSESQDSADSAQGWVVSHSELEARELIGENTFLQKMPYTDLSIPVGTVIVTDGTLERACKKAALS